MAAPSPRKFVPLAPGHDPSTSTKSIHSSTDISYTKRAFFAAVVVEESVHGLSPDVQELITALGTRITDQTSQDVDKSSNAQSLSGSDAADLHRSATTRKRAVTTNAQIQRSIGHKRTLTQTDALQDMIREMVTTERTYVKRLRILKQDYADPLRNFSKKKEEALLDKYKAKTLFGNVDQLLLTSESFLIDLEKMIGPNGRMLVGGLGDVCLKHFRDKASFDCYKLYYSKREEAQSIFEEEDAKGTKTGFHGYIERIKYSSSDLRNRIGLRELLAEPIQRIPRYTMMWQNIIKEMDEADPQRAKLMEAEKIASKIAICESDDQTKRATTMYCLERTIEGFPPGLISNNRKFIDCIDVEDMPIDTAPTSGAASTSSNGIGALFCTLFLFDDRLIIVKRPNGTSSGRTLARLNEIEKILRTNALNSVKKSGMSCKGVVDVLDVTATDVGGSDLHFYLENPPTGQTDRWNGRAFRSYAVVLPPAPLNLDPTATQAAKRRFLENLWTVQALYRVKNGRCVAVRSEEVNIESKGGRTTQATAFYNLYQRTPYLGEARKPKVVVHVDPSREADAVPFGIVGGPFVIIRLQPMEGGLCRYNVTCHSPDEDEEEHIVHSEMVPGRIINTIHQFGLFTFRTGAVSRPSTPTASTRSRAAVFGLDAISRTLMGASRSGGDVFSFGASVSGTIGGTRRSRGNMSRSSTQTMSTAFTESTNRFSYRSTSTAATSYLGDESMSSSKSPRKLVKPAKSSGPTEAEDIFPQSLGERNGSRGRSIEIVEPVVPPKPDKSERDLAQRLELARQNSLSQPPIADTASFMLRDPPFAETIYEEDPPVSRVSQERRRTLLGVDIEEEEEHRRPDSITPTKASPLTPAKALPALPKKPTGPRRATLTQPKLVDLQSFDLDIDNALDETIAAFSPPHYPIDLSDEDTPTKFTFEPIIRAEGVFRTPTRSSTASVVEPLSIKKKSSVKPRKSPGSFRRIPVREPGSPSPSARRRSSGLQHTASMVRSPPSRSSVSGKDVERIVVVARTTKEDLSSARRAMKRIKQEVEVLKDDVAANRHEDRGGAISPTGGRGLVRSPHTRHIVTQAAEARMEEMRQMIERRGVGGFGESALHRSPSMVAAPVASSLDPTRLEQWTKTMESLVEDADQQIAQAIDQSEALVKDMTLLAVHNEPSSREELEKAQLELQNSARQKDVLKQLLQDATAENEGLYSAFNNELDAMYQDVQLPEDQAWSAMIKDLQSAKKTRNQLSKDNFHYKQKLKIAEEKNEELLALLRAHGLDPGQ